MSVKKYRKLPVVVEAIHHNSEFFQSSLDFINSNGGHAALMLDGRISIETLEGTMIGEDGDYVIKGINGEFYPCKKDIFDKSYELTEGE